jgi:hypothetical protein
MPSSNITNAAPDELPWSNISPAGGGVELNVDAGAVVLIAGLDLAADAGVVGVLDQLADADFLRGVEVFRQHLEQAGQVQVERWRSLIDGEPPGRPPGHGAEPGLP